MSSPSETPESSEEATTPGPDEFLVTIPKDGSIHYEFSDHEAVQRFFGTQVLTTPEALRQVVGEVRHPPREGRSRNEPVEQRSVPVAKSAAHAQESIADETIVDQRCGLVPKDLYLRLARQRAFPSRKIGKRIVARWGDVRVAFLDGPGVQNAGPRPADTEPEDDGLDDLRRQLRLVEKSK